MIRPLHLAFLGTMLGASLFAQQNAVTPPHTNLRVGDMAPDFTLPATTGDKVTLSSFRGKAPVVLAFFSAAFAGGCTKEMLGYQAGMGKFEGTSTKIFGVSGDNIPSQKEFAKQLNVAFPILSDFATRKVMADYGVLLPNSGMANRATFVIDRDGKIVHIEEGSGAIDPSGAEMACSKLAHNR